MDVARQHVEELMARERVERGQRLIEEQHRRPGPKGECELDVRALPAGEVPSLLAQGDAQLLEPIAGQRSVKARAQCFG